MLLLHSFEPDDKFFVILVKEDAHRATASQKAGCPFCGGRLDRADYPRKPRGAVAGESLDRRISLCCGREGCRRRVTPASLVFMGRRLYLAVVVLVETLREAARVLAGASPAPPTAPQSPAPVVPRAAPTTPRAGCAPSRTVRRWLLWFRTTLPQSPMFQAARGVLWPPLESEKELPQGLVQRLGDGQSWVQSLVATLRFLSPLSTVQRARSVGGA
jgi:hypothetical protein